MKRNDAETELLSRGLVDMLQLSEIISVVSRHHGISPKNDSAIAPTLAAIRSLLDSGYVTAGDVITNREGLLQVQSWQLNPQEAVAAIEREWRELEEPPNLGDVVWLELTDAGRAEALRREHPGQQGRSRRVLTKRTSRNP